MLKNLQQGNARSRRDILSRTKDHFRDSLQARQAVPSALRDVDKIFHTWTIDMIAANHEQMPDTANPNAVDGQYSSSLSPVVTVCDTSFNNFLM
jgi:hypothetical protein